MSDTILKEISEEISKWPDEKEPMDRNILDAYKFIYSMLDPEGFGHAVSAEVRDGARQILGMPKVEQASYGMDIYPEPLIKNTNE